MTARPAERLLTVSEAADILSTSERFPRRLIDERRIRFVRVGRHVRIPESALRDFIAAGLVEPITTQREERKVASCPNDDSAESGGSRRAVGRHDIQAQTESTGLRQRRSAPRKTLTSG